MTVKIEKCNYLTGLRRGYVKVADRKVSELKPVPENLNGLRGNFRKAMQRCIESGCNFYTTQDQQDSRSNQYCYTIYRGYFA